MTEAELVRYKYGSCGNAQKLSARLHAFLCVAVGSLVRLGMYKPIFDRNRSIKSEQAEQEKDFKSCMAQNEKDSKDEEKSFEKTGIYFPAFQTDCLQFQYRWHQDAINSYQRETLSDTYWRVGGWKIAAYCILPALAGYLLMLAIWWAIAGF